MVISVLWFQDTTYRPDPGLTSSVINCFMKKSVKKIRQLSKNWPVCYVCSPAVTKWTTELQNRTLHNIFFSTLLLPGQSVSHQLRDLGIICLSCIFQQWVCFSPLLISMWTLPDEYQLQPLWVITSPLQLSLVPSHQIVQASIFNSSPKLLHPFDIQATGLGQCLIQPFYLVDW